VVKRRWNETKDDWKQQLQQTGNGQRSKREKKGADIKSGSGVNVCPVNIQPHTVTRLFGGKRKHLHFFCFIDRLTNHNTPDGGR